MLKNRIGLFCKWEALGQVCWCLYRDGYSATAYNYPLSLRIWAGPAARLTPDFGHLHICVGLGYSNTVGNMQAPRHRNSASVFNERSTLHWWHSSSGSGKWVLFKQTEFHHSCFVFLNLETLLPPASLHAMIEAYDIKWSPIILCESLIFCPQKEGKYWWLTIITVNSGRHRPVVTPRCLQPIRLPTHSLTFCCYEDGN